MLMWRPVVVNRICASKWHTSSTRVDRIVWWIHKELTQSYLAKVVYCCTGMVRIITIHIPEQATDDFCWVRRTRVIPFFWHEFFKLPRRTSHCSRREADSPNAA